MFKPRKLYVLQKTRPLSKEDVYSKPLHHSIERPTIEVIGAFTSYKKAFHAMLAFIDSPWLITPGYSSYKLSSKDDHPPKEDAMSEDNSYMFTEMDVDEHSGHIHFISEYRYKIQIFEDI